MGRAGGTPAIVSLLMASAAAGIAGERIVVGFGHIPPATFRGPSGQVQGFAADVIREAARREGVDIEWRRIGGSRDAEIALDEGAIDLWPVALDTSERRRKYFVSEPWWHEDMSLLVRTDGPRGEDELAGKRITLSSPMAFESAARAFPRSSLLKPDPGKDGPWSAAIPVCQGVADAGLMTHRDADEILAVRPPACAGTQLAIIDSTATVGVALMTARSRSALAQRLRRRIDELTEDGTLTRIAASHPGIPSASATALAERIRDRSQRRQLWLIVAALALLTVVGAALMLRMRGIQQALRASEQRYRSLFESMKEGFHLSEIICDDAGKPVDWRFLAVNSAFEALMGRPREQVLGRTCREVFPDFTCDQWAADLGDVALNGTPRQFDANMRGRQLQITAYAPRKGQFAVLLNDVSERNHAEEALRRSNDDLQAFAYTVSHDLQEPLRMVIAYVDLLARHYGDSLDNKPREFMEVIRTGALRMNGLLNDLLQFSRAGQDAALRTDVDAHLAAQTALEALRHRVDETGAEVIIGELPVVRAWKGRLEQVFQNVIENALKYRRADVPPHVEITAEAKDGMWCFSVSDHGIGLNTAYADRIFRVFQRLHVRSEYSGNGIGLAISKRIIERHGGRIWVDWSEIGCGTRFCFTLPIKGASTVADT